MKKFKNSGLSTDSRKLQTLALKHLEDMSDTSLFQSFRLYGAKRGEEENQRGAGSGSESEGTPRVQQILVKPMNGLF